MDQLSSPVITDSEGNKFIGAEAESIKRLQIGMSVIERTKKRYLLTEPFNGLNFKQKQKKKKKKKKKKERYVCDDYPTFISNNNNDWQDKIRGILDGDKDIKLPKTNEHTATIKRGIDK
jgi:hypothetical protein